MIKMTNAEQKAYDEFNSVATITMTTEELIQQAFVVGYKAGEAPKSYVEHSRGFDTHEQRRDRFVDEWNAMVHTVSTFATLWDLPKPQMVFHPKWLRTMNAYSNTRLAPTIINMDVKIRFAIFETAEIIRIDG